MYLDYTELNGNCSILIFAPPKRYLISRKCLLKCLDPFSRTLAEATDLALCHQRLGCAAVQDTIPCSD